MEDNRILRQVFDSRTTRRRRARPGATSLGAVRNSIVKRDITWKDAQQATKNRNKSKQIK